MSVVVALVLSALAAGGAPAPVYSIQAIRYASAPSVPASMLMVGGDKDEKVDIAMIVWLIRGGGRNILFDSGFHRDVWFKRFPVTDYMRPDEAVALAGVKPEEVTDVVVSHAHWDHMGGIDLFPKATVWIQKQEYSYYTADAWQPGGRHGGIHRIAPTPEHFQARGAGQRVCGSHYSTRTHHGRTVHLLTAHFSSS